MRPRVGRRLPVLLGGIGVLAFALLSGWGVTPASAHNYLVSSSPEDGAVVTEQPGVFTITTNDAVLDIDGTGAGSAIQISGPSDAPLYYGDGCLSIAGPTAETTAELGTAGVYTVTWQVVSTDGHPISDTLTFDWQPSAGQSLGEGSASAPTCGGTTNAVPDAPADTDGTGGWLGDVGWIVAALGAVGIVVTVTLLVLRRRS